MTAQSQVLRPCDLAERWQCSEGHVRTLARKGALPFFRAGGKLLRFRLHDIEAYECGSSNTAASSPPNGSKKASDDAARLVRLTL